MSVLVLFFHFDTVSDMSSALVMLGTKKYLVSTIPLNRCSAMRIFGFSPEVLEIYMTSREVSVVKRVGKASAALS